jgi:hypothetical protein
MFIRIDKRRAIRGTPHQRDAVRGQWATDYWLLTTDHLRQDGHLTILAAADAQSRAYRQQHSEGSGKNSANFFNFAKSAKCVGGRTMANGGQKRIDPPPPKNWQTGKLNFFSDATFIAASAYIDK